MAKTVTDLDKEVVQLRADLKELQKVTTPSTTLATVAQWTGTVFGALALGGLVWVAFTAGGVLARQEANEKAVADLKKEIGEIRGRVDKLWDRPHVQLAGLAVREGMLQDVRGGVARLVVDGQTQEFKIAPNLQVYNASGKLIPDGLDSIVLPASGTPVRVILTAPDSNTISVIEFGPKKEK